MSTQARTAQRGGKNKSDSVSSTKTQKADAKSDPPKILDNPKAQPTAEQMRIAQIIDTKPDDRSLQEKIKKVMDITTKTEDEVITALHDCDNDCDRAVNMLLEGKAQGEWETSGKKRKNRQPSTTKSSEITNSRPGNEGDPEEGESAVPAANIDKDKSKNRNQTRSKGRGGNENRRGRENKENEHSTEEGFARNRPEGGFRRANRGMANGPGGRGGRGGRGGGRLGSRTFQSRDKSGGGSFPRSIDTWNNPPVPDAEGGSNLKMENWNEFPSPEDWDNEEYTGSLADSKVFTPTGGIETSVVAPEQLQDSSNQEILMSSTAQDYHQANQLPPSPLPVGVGTLNAAQTQYLSQLTAQSENLKSAVGIGTGSTSYGQTTGSSYGQSTGSSTAYGQGENIKSAIGSSVPYNQSSNGNTYQSTGSSATTSYGQSGTGSSTYGPTPSAAASGYGQSGSYGQSGQAGYGTSGSATGGYGQAASGYGQSSGSNYGQQSQAYGQANSSAFQSSTNANTYGQTGTGYGSNPPNSASYQGGSSGNAYSANTGATNAYQSSGTGANVYPSSGGAGSTNTYQGSGSGTGGYPSAGTAGSNTYQGTTGSGVYPVSGSQGSNTYQNSSSQNYQGNAVSGSSYPGSTGSVAGGNTSYQSGSTSFHAGGGQPSVFTSQTYSNSNNYGNQLPDGSVPGTDLVQSTQPARTKTQRARVPPPSKIPQSAVEMPEDSINASISFLDVQFGGLEFGSEGGSFETGTSATTTSSETTSTSTTTDSQNAALDGYSTASSSSVKNNQATLVSALTGKSVLTNNEALSMQSSTEHKTGFSNSSRVASSNSGLDLSKSDVGLSYSTPSSVNYPSYQSQKTNSTGTGVYQQTGYSATNFSSSTPQVTSSSTSYSTNQSQANNYNNQTGGSSSFPNSSYSQSSNAGVPNYPNSGNTYQSNSTFTNTNQQYQSSGYGSALTSGYPSTNQYQNSYGVSSTTSTQNKLNSALTSSGKETQEYTASTTVSSLTNTTNSGLTNATLTSSAQTVNTTSTKVSSATTKSSVVANIPPGVPPIMSHQYMISQTGMPYFQPPTMYSYEDLQLLQQRIPHVATGYYDMAYQAPTSLATGRDSLANVAYSIADARYTRGDNNASPVPSTLSQQTASQAHQQPVMNHPSFPPGYTYAFYGTTAGMMPGSFQYGTPTLYPLPAATNAHGSTTSSQYPKPGAYASAYGSGYEGLSQTQDYAKSAYVSNNQTQSKSGDSGSSAGPRTQSSAQPNKSGTKPYNPYWTQNIN